MRMRGTCPFGRLGKVPETDTWPPITRD